MSLTIFLTPASFGLAFALVLEQLLVARPCSPGASEELPPPPPHAANKKLVKKSKGRKRFPNGFRGCVFILILQVINEIERDSTVSKNVDQHDAGKIWSLGNHRLR